jgi:hypothetical protein
MPHHSGDGRRERVLRLLAIWWRGETPTGEATGFSLRRVLLTLALVLAPLWLALASLALREAGSRPEERARVACVEHLHGLVLALMMYAEENDGLLPPADKRPGQDAWVAALPRTRVVGGFQELLYCPLDTRRQGSSSYRLPQSAGGLSLTYLRSHPKTVILTEKRPFHRGRRMTAFADGTVRLVGHARAGRARAGSRP